MRRTTDWVYEESDYYCRADMIEADIEAELNGEDLI